MIKIKNCGMSTPEAIHAAVQTGAEFIGFIHYPKSVRHIHPLQAASLAMDLPEGVKSVAVMVNPSNEEVDDAHYADYLQLHGDERPERVLAIKELSGKPIIKAKGIASAQDLTELPIFQAVADMLLLDTKHEDYGGTGEAFDWSLLQGMQFAKPWFLSGGLDAGNIARALAQTHAPMVDVSSGIEREKGVKDLSMIKQFNEAVRNASQ
jgi:phosphoribosylanthranilate isomerase